jgi:hypothetical protein
MCYNPSTLVRLVLLADRLLPFIRRVEPAIEGRRFGGWLHETSSWPSAMPASAAEMLR